MDGMGRDGMGCCQTSPVVALLLMFSLFIAAASQQVVVAALFLFALWLQSLRLPGHFVQQRVLNPMPSGKQA
jgi:hypothetical protein